MTTLTPISSITPTGLHWIEASAGTGKTFTLSSLVVRMLMQSYMPSQIITTTFTRAATAELKARVRSRLSHLLRFMETRTGFTQKENQAHADTLDDELHALILRDFSHQPGFACERARLMLDQLEYLFIGTLDSLCQKLLREFAFESGSIERADITDNSRQYLTRIIHDGLREWASNQDEQLLDLMIAKGSIGTAQSYIKLVEDSLNFQSAEFISASELEFSIDTLVASYAKVQDIQLQEFEQYFLEHGMHFKGISGTYFKPTTKFTKLFKQSIPKLLGLLAERNYQGLFSGDFAEHQQLLDTLLKTCDTEKTFSAKCSVSAQQDFYSHTKIIALLDLIREIKRISEQVSLSEIHLKYHLCQQAKRLLPELLQQKRETTFSQQIISLNNALQGLQGQAFAQAVHDKYPLIIIDESQDTNQEQDNVLAAIWRDPQRSQTGGMIMVGDRKQAIYGFRGGDMLTFVNAHREVGRLGGKFYDLLTNYRTIPPLISAVDALFQANPDFGDWVIYPPATASSKPHPVLMDLGQANPVPLRWLKLTAGLDPHIQVAQQVLSLLSRAQEGQLYFSAGDTQTSLIEDDIAILAKSNDDLDRIQYELERIGICVNRSARRSVFDGGVAHDLAALLLALNSPADYGKLRRALLSPIFGLSVSKLKALEESADGLGGYISEFYKIRDTWMKIGFLSAWQQLVQTFPVWQNLVTSNGKDSERAVVNLRHLAEMLGQFSARHTGIQGLTQWYLKQVSNPAQREWEMERSLSNEKGVKLLTIHKSKGLEFKVVFLFKADGASKEMNKTLNYSATTLADGEQEQQKRVIEVGGAVSVSAKALSEHAQRLESETRRQWYVALTRATHRMYVMLHNESTNANGVGYWYHAHGGFDHPQSAVVSLIEDYGRLQKRAGVAQQITAMDLPQHKYFPKKQTNFTGLCQHLNAKQAQDFLVDHYAGSVSLDEFQAEVISDAVGDQPLLPIAKSFPMGVLAGTSLHDFLDLIDFTRQDNWHNDIYRRFKNGHFSVYAEMLDRYRQQHPGLSDELLIERLMEDLVGWFEHMTACKIQGELCLNHLGRGAYLSEMPFVLSLSDRIFDSSGVYTLMRNYGYSMPELNRAETARFINGSVDLVYQYRNKFYIADYKSNYLGGDYAHYEHDQLHKNMLQSSYYLQATLYLVALHRYLKKRILNYRPEEHLGGATYLYLRGMHKEANTGVFQWVPPIAMILEMDDLLGVSAVGCQN